MGIINVTPDSFFSGSRYDEANVLKAAEQMLQEGADILDIGGYSSRPDADEVSEEEEINRVVGPIRLIKEKFPQSVISIDTFRSEVAKKAIQSGAAIVNDISGGHLDEQMIPTVAKLQVPYIAMHMRGTPQTMKQLTDYDDLLQEMMKYFSEIIEKCKNHGLHDLIIDPGFGFAKTVEQNFEIFKRINHFSCLEKPILVGVSRKSMIYKTLAVSQDNALNGTSILNTVALMKGADILRVHDVREAKEAIILTQKTS